MDKRLEIHFLKAKTAEKSGDVTGAMRIYLQILAAVPDNARAKKELGKLRRAFPAAPASPAAPEQPVQSVPADEMNALVALYQRGDMAAVVTAARALFARHPTAVPVLGMLGIAQARLGQRELAAKAFMRAITLKPDYAEAHFNLGNVLTDAGKLDEAVISYRRAIDIKPDYAVAHANLGGALKQQGKPDEAIAAYRQAVAARPDHAQAHYNLGNTLKAQGQIAEAVVAYRQALAVQPQNADAHNNLGNALRELQMWDAAIDAFARAAAIRPDFAEAHHNLGNALLDRDRLAEAEAAYRRALELRPDHAHSWSGLGKTLLERGQAEAAEEAVRRSLAITPDAPEALLHLATAMVDQSRFDEAIVVFREALAIDPDQAEVATSMALLHLLLGQFEQGWLLYESRRKVEKLVGARTFTQPLWLGEQDIAGKSVLIHHEQGFGDTFQFARYAAMVRDRGARTTLCVQAPLQPLLADAFPGVQVVANDDVAAEFDYHTPLLSLPLAFETDLGSIPAGVPYLSADPARVAAWDERLGRQGFRIGICWQGSPGKVDRGRSIPLAEFAGLAKLPGVRLISLHKGAGEAQLDTLPAGMRVEIPGPDFDRAGAAYVDSAAVMKACDLVISSDTSVLHLAGALGVPVWAMLRRIPDWRWLLGRDDSPWYPTMRLFRQDAPGDWASAFAKAEAALCGLIEARLASSEDRRA